MDKEMRKNRRRGKVGRRLLGVFLALNLFISAFSGIVFFHYTPKVAKAADTEEGKIQIMIDEKAYSESNPYTMRSSTISLVLDDASAATYSSSDYTVDWHILGSTTPAKDEDDVLKITSSSRTTCQVKSKNKYDESTVEVVVQKTSGDVYKSARVKINVAFGIDTWGTGFSVINGERALCLNLGSPKDLKLSMGGTATWSRVDSDVISIDQATGKVTPVGVGTTTITAIGPGEGQEHTIPVYVAPGVTTKVDKNTARNYSSTLPKSNDPNVDEQTIKSGSYVYVNAVFDSSSPKRFNEKVYWEIQDDNGVILCSTDNPEPANSPISVEYPYGARSNVMKVSGVSGEYDMYLYAVGTKNSFTSNQRPYEISNAHLVIASNIEYKEEILGVGDRYSLPLSYNLNEATFDQYFEAKIWQDDPAVDWKVNPQDYGINCDEYAVAPTSANKYTITTKKEGKIVAVMHVKSSEAKVRIQELTGLDTVPDYFVTKIAITDKITLSSESMTMMIGQSQTLHVTNNTGTTGAIEWTSSNPSLVSIEDTNGVNNTIKALGKTTQPGVTITASLYVGNGTYRRATCLVTVIEALTSFTLNPSDKLTLNVGKSEYVFAEVPNSESVEEVPLMWQSADADVISITPKDGNKSALITGKKGGKTVLMVTNTLDWSVERLEVEVIVPVKSVEFEKDEYVFPAHNDGKSMKQFLKIEPSDATSSDIEWSVTDTTVASIDQEGYLKFLNPGSVTVKAKVKTDYVGIPVATTLVKITGGPEDIIFENLKDDHLDIEAGDTKTVNLKFVPATAETNLIWRTDRAGVCHLDYHDDKRELEVVGQKPGSCTVTCRTDDNVYYSFTVTCTEASTGIEFEKDSVTLYNGDPINGKFQLVPKLKPETSTDTVSYKMRDEKIATVSDKGLLTAVAAGKTYVSATTSSGKTAIVDVIVVDKVTKVTGDFKRATVYIGEALTISPKITPQTAANKNIKWSWEPYETDDPGSIEMDERGTEVIVTGKTEGMVVLTGVSEDNSSAYVEYTLTVKYRTPQYSTKVTLSPKVKYVNVGKKFKVSRSVKNAYNGNRTLRWKSSNRRVATVSSSGRVKARKVGKATISATCLDGSKAKGSMKVVVRRLVTKIKMNKSNANILVGRSVRLSVRITPSNATIKGVKWKSGDTSIATVDGGKVIGVAPGMVKITATSKDATKKKTYCWVTVSEPVPVTNFTIADANLTVAKGSTIQSGMVPNPSNATDSIKYWSDTPSVASVTSKGKIKGLRPGKATIYARAANGVEGHVDVTVVDINRKAVTLLQYATEQLSIYNITTGITWYSAKPEIASVDANGLVKAKLPGKTIIYAYVDGVKLGCEVTVKRIQ